MMKTSNEVISMEEEESMDSRFVYEIYLTGYPYSLCVLGKGEESLMCF